MTLTLENTQVSPQIHVGDIGSQFLITILDQSGEIVDISTATQKEVIFLSSSRVEKVKTASFYTNGTDGKIVYTLQSGDIDVDGLWKYQAKIIMPSGTWFTNIEDFRVYPNI